MAMAVVCVFCGSSFAADTVAYDKNAISGVEGSHTLTAVSDQGSDVVITLTNVRTTQMGVDTKGQDLNAPTAIALYSGIMDAKGVQKPFVVAPVVNGTATFRIPNIAKVAGVPVVEHLWGRSTDGKRALVHDPADQFVVSKGGDLNTLCIGIVMFPNGPTVSLKPFGKLDQGKHPELAVKH